jgi:hypothetical protein
MHEFQQKKVIDTHTDIFVSSFTALNPVVFFHPLPPYFFLVEKN